jgi:hypothetical protein
MVILSLQNLKGQEDLSVEVQLVNSYCTRLEILLVITSLMLYVILLMYS